MRSSAFAAIAAVLGACSSPTESERWESVETSTSAIVLGTPSTEEEDFVVNVYGPEFCTGTLIAPNVVLTARHCVAQGVLDGYRCDDQGNLIEDVPGAGRLGATRDPASIGIRVGPEVAGTEPVAHGVRIFDSGSNNICVNDIAIVVIDRELSPPPQRVRLGQRTPRGEKQTLIGYGQDESGALQQTRRRRSGVAVLAVGEFLPYEREGSAAPRTFVTGQGACHGDSGGPAFSEETGAVTGVYSLVKGACDSASVRNVFTQVAPFAKLFRDAMTFAGAELLVEPERPEENGGAGGMGGGAGEEEGGTENGTAGAGASGGSEPSVAGGGGAPAGIAGNRGKGTGSREDVSCACRAAGLGTKGRSEWAAMLLVLAAGAFVRRRAR